GYDVSAEGMLAAAHDGYLRVQKPTAREVVYLEPADGAAYLKIITPEQASYVIVKALQNVSILLDFRDQTDDQVFCFVHGYAVHV
ncbi:MAG: hypothetical protein ACFFD4_40765, partial [Candidatus Odinarchaeota archaeon]